VKLARAARVTGLGSEVKTAVKGDRALIKDIRQARRDARKAIGSLRHSES
jgi:phosphoribosylamine-glycine ligase